MLMAAMSLRAVQEFWPESADAKLEKHKGSSSATSRPQGFRAITICIPRISRASRTGLVPVSGALIDYSAARDYA